MFERFTDRARRAIVLAQEEARLLNHNYIGTEHILLGILREEEGVGAQALTSLGISVEAARQMTEEIIGAGQSPPSGQIPFTPRAKKVLELSLRESRHLGHNYIGTEHVLLGLVREGEGVAAQVLKRLGATLSDAREAVVAMLAGLPSEERGAWPLRPRRGREKARSVLSMAEMVGDEDELGPHCPNCRERFPSSLAWERMQGVGEDTKRIAMVVVFCMDCGTTLGVLPDTEPTDPYFPGSASPGS